MSVLLKVIETFDVKELEKSYDLNWIFKRKQKSTFVRFWKK